MASRYKILMYESMHPEGTRVLEERCDLVYADSLDPKRLKELVADADSIMIRANGAVTAEIMDAAPRLKVIGRHGVGLDGIDMPGARERGIMVVYTPVANMQSVAEHFVCLALVLSKKVRQADIALREGRWQARYELIGGEMKGKTIGVLGFGRIGQATARICHFGLGMPVLYSDVIPHPEAEAEMGARRVSTEQVFSEADYISVNLPLLPDTRGSINASLIKRMKPTGILVNMARGPVWNEADVVAALKAGTIAGAGSDVYETEPASPENPLFALDNFVGTPHMSAHTEESMIKMSLVANDMLAVLDGRRPEFPAPGFADMAVRGNEE